MLSVESERALRDIARAGNPNENHDVVCALVMDDCLANLIAYGYVREVWDYPDRAYYEYEECNGYELTIKGRNYFSNKRRVWLNGNSGAIIAAVSSILAAVIGFFLGRLTS